LEFGSHVLQSGFWQRLSWRGFAFGAPLGCIVGISYKCNRMEVGEARACQKIITLVSDL
jgi:hypothetical protein